MYYFESEFLHTESLFFGALFFQLFESKIPQGKINSQNVKTLIQNNTFQVFPIITFFTN